jgi:hypothetical protein
MDLEKPSMRARQSALTFPFSKYLNSLKGTSLCWGMSLTMTGNP